MLKTVSRARVLPVREASGGSMTAAALPWQLVINTERERFRAVLVQAPATDALTLDRATLDVLQLRVGDRARVSEFDNQATGGQR